MPEKPLLKALTEAGAGPRRRLAEAIKQGKVKVNGQTAASFTQPVDTARNKVTLDGRAVKLKPDRTVYLMLNKPAGIVTTVREEKGRKTVLDILPERYKSLRLYPVGRLDKNTTGLLLMTNDGDLTYRLTHPKFEHEKEYMVRISGRLTRYEKHQLVRGIKLEDGLTNPAVVKEITAAPYNYSITIREGRKRQVHRMFEKLGHNVLALKRWRTGGLTLGDMKEGEVRALKAGEIAALLKI
jgi:23S rRNA pseudouridine2605 synthase